MCLYNSVWFRLSNAVERTGVLCVEGHVQLRDHLEVYSDQVEVPLLPMFVSGESGGVHGALIMLSPMKDPECVSECTLVVVLKKELPKCSCPGWGQV